MTSPHTIPSVSMSRSSVIFYLFLAGSLLGIAFPPLPLGVLAFIGFVPLLVVLEHTTTLKQTLWRLYCAFFVFHGASNWWVSSWQREADPYLMMAGVALWIGHPLFFAVPMIGYTVIRRHAGRAAALVALPFLWTAFEWAHSLGQLSYPWQALGYTQSYHTPFIQIADVTGVWGISFVIVAVNSGLAHLWFVYQEQPSTPVFVRLGSTALQARLQVVCLLALVFVPLVYGVFRMKSFDHQQLLQSSRTLMVGVIQPNINPWDKWSGSSQAQVESHIRLQDSLRTAFSRQNNGESLHLAIWSEVAIPYRILAPINIAYFQALRQWTDSTGVALLTGIPSDTVYASRTQAPTSAMAAPRGSDTVYYDSFNTTMLLAPQKTHDEQTSSTAPFATQQLPTQSLPLYRKMRLTPFAERVPYADVFSFMVKALTWNVGISGWQIGPRQHCLALPFKASAAGSMKAEFDTTRIGTIICIESIYPDFVAGFARTGAEMLTVVTNDGWFNHTPGPEQHYCIAVLRAVETRRYLARCANTGVSGFITPTGISLQKTVNATRAGIAETIPLLQELSPYTRFGDWLPMACMLASIAALVWAWRKR